MDYTTWLLVLEMLTDQISVVFNTMDGVSFVTMPMYTVTLLDLICIFMFYEECVVLLDVLKE